MSTSADTSSLLGVVEVPVRFYKEVVDGFAALKAPTACNLLGERLNNKSSGAFPGSQDFCAKLPNLAVDLTVKEVTSLIRLFCQHGVTLFGAGALTTIPGDTVAKTWRLCQMLCEKYTSWHYRHRCTFARTTRRWDDLSPWNIGTVYQTASPGRWTRGRESLVIGAPCPTCARGRLVLLAHPDMGCAGVCCNAGCRDSRPNPYTGIPGQQIHGSPIGKTTDESAIWREPSRPQGVNVFLPYQQLGCPVV